MFRRIFIVGLVAGLICGLATTAVQTAWTVPLVLEAETYENPRAAPPGGHDHAAHGHAGETAGHDHGGDGRMPGDGLERLLWTAVANVLLAVGAGLVLAGAFALSGFKTSWRVGAAWGAAGFVAFALAPAVGLPPELPGMTTSAVEGRQAWWAFTALATAAALALSWLPTPTIWKTAAVGLALVPHLIGAPAGHGHEGAVPQALISEFAWASLLTAAFFWLAIGTLAGGIFARIDPVAEESGYPAAAAMHE